MPLPVILGILAAAGLGAGMGTMQRKVEDSRKQDDMMREIMLKTVMGGGEIPADQAKKLFGDRAEILPFLSKAIQATQQRQFGMAQGMLNEDQPLNGGNPTVAGGSALTQAGPQVPGDAPGSPAAPPPMPWQPPMLLPAEAPSTAPTQAEGMTFDPRQAPTQRTFKARPGVSMKVGDMTLSAPGVGSVQAAEANRAGFGFQQQRDLDQLFSSASKRQLPYNELVKQMDQMGLSQLPQAKDMAERYGQASYAQAERDAVAQVMGKSQRLPTAAETQEVKWQAWYRSGYGPAPVENQETLDQRYLKSVQASVLSGIPFAAADAATRSVLGGAPSQQAVAQIAEFAKAAAQRQIQSQNPNLNPAAVQSDVNKAVGQLGVTEAERTRANASVDMSQETKDVYTSQGLTPPLQAQMRGAPAAGPLPGAAIEQGKTAATAKAGAQAQATAEGGAKGKQATAAGDLVPDTELFEKYAGLDSEPPRAGMTRGELNASINKGDIGVLHLDKRTHRNLQTIEGVVKGYSDNLETLRPLLDKGTLTRLMTRLGAAPTPVEFLGHKFTWLTVPALTDAQLKDAGITPAQAKAAAAWVHYNNTALLTLRSIGEGERGNVAQRIIGRGEETFPNLSDNARTAQAKIELLHKRIAVERAASVTYKGREWVMGPKGQVGTVPKGSKMPTGWEMVR